MVTRSGSPIRRRREGSTDTGRPSVRTRLVLPPTGRNRNRNRFLLGAAVAALLAHVLAVATLLALPRLLALPAAAPGGGDPPTIEMVEDDAKAAGGSQPTPRSTSAPTSTAKPMPDSRSAPSPAPGTPLSTDAPQATTAELAPPAPERRDTAPTPSSPAPAAQAPEQPNVDLDPTDGLGYGHQDDPQIIPATPDNRHANRMPVYPRDAGRRGEEGSVRMLVMINPDGTVSHVELAVSSGHPELDRTAVRAVSGWHFRPAMEDGRPVPTQMMQTFNFHILRPGEASR